MSEDPRAGWTSASNAGADRLCPGRHNAQKGMPDIKGEYAEHGQAIHKALASDDPAFKDVLTTDQRDMFDSHREIEKKVISQVWPGYEQATSPRTDPTATRVWRHERYWCKVPITDGKPYTVFFQHSGEADFVMRRGGKILIQDYKSLAGDVPESPKNEQLRDLAVMAWRTLIAEEVIVVINQPLVTWSPELCRYDKAALERAEQEMWERVRKSNDPKAPRQAGAVQCKFCKAKHTCYEHAQWVSVMVPTMTDLSTPVSEWTPEQRALFCERLPIAQAWLDDCKDQMKLLLGNEPNAVPGWYLAPGGTRESIVNPQELFNRFRELAMAKAEKQSQKEGVTDTPDAIVLTWFMEAVRINKGDLEQQVRNATGEKGRGLKANVVKLLEGLTESHPIAPSLEKKK